MLVERVALMRNHGDQIEIWRGSTVFMPRWYSDLIGRELTLNAAGKGEGDHMVFQ